METVNKTTTKKNISFQRLEPSMAAVDGGDPGGGGLPMNQWSASIGARKRDRCRYRRLTRLKSQMSTQARAGVCVCLCVSLCVCVCVCLCFDAGNRRERNYSIRLWKSVAEVIDHPPLIAVMKTLATQQKHINGPALRLCRICLGLPASLSLCVCVCVCVRGGDGERGQWEGVDGWRE